jgi:N-acetylglucosamine kinase-like BadF-type ATPase
MSDRFAPPTPTQARAAVAGLHRATTLDPSAIELAKAKLCCANIDSAIRRYVQESGTSMNDIQTAHLVGLLLAEAGVAYNVATRVEDLVRQLVVDVTR